MKLNEAGRTGLFRMVHFYKKKVIIQEKDPSIFQNTRMLYRSLT
ncbi:hypothetical protein ERICIV_02878 [Paenibacillus larvae subsp. larvae]|uniref:Uncharacterized protein n=1 Tax=Paenibacillus larvae subsp. larvae TaxID=147375 RepID=A0A2L1UFQ5_9BACL|nr:hypothetical protein ERICIII_02887 [Paenibacillus larvae subsp. larvae]AVF31767.1 hypothetical protein ERICIV_02878 [Paenibacillus larvae subsp. larvae]